MADRLKADPLTLLKEGAAALRLDLAPSVLEQFRLYLEEVWRWNARINLTGAGSPEELVLKHFLDSLAVLPWLPPGPSLADLGAGAGFPGLVLKLARPEMELTLVESRGKKAVFLRYLASLLKLEGVAVGEEHLTPALARTWGPRFHLVISRATFSLPRFLEVAAPLLLPGGMLLALKGPGLKSGEIKEAETRLAPLGLGPLNLKEYRLPLTGQGRLLVMAAREV
jgi:16S rRNA (guanine527-N7)-methyltransferase